MTETAQNPRYQDIALPALLRWGQQTYGGGMRRALAEAGCDDIPPNGMFVVGERGPELGVKAGSRVDIISNPEGRSTRAHSVTNWA